MTAPEMDGGRDGLPAEVARRTAQEREAHLFATDLSVQEFLLARGLGYDTAGVVMGSSIYHVGWQWSSAYRGGELSVVSAAHLDARSLALGRMQEEAAARGAHGVTGVRLTAKEHDWGTDLIEFTAIGTAVRLRGARPAERPFLSDLSGDDFWTLLQAGAAPRGVAMGYCAYLSAPMQPTWNRRRSPWANWEVESYTEALYQARHLAMARARDDLQRLGATGLVGARFETRMHTYQSGSDHSTSWQQLRIDLLVLGTAIVEARAEPIAPPPLTGLNMTGVRPMRPARRGAELQE